MIYRPHFTYIAAGTPEQTQAREAAANEEWRKRLIFHPIKLPIVAQPSPPRLIGLPRPPPTANPPIYGIGRAPIYNPPGQPVVKRPIPEATEENEEWHPGFLLLPRLLLPRREPANSLRLIPRPPPTANPPIYGVARAPIYSPPRLYSPPRFVNPQNQEPEPPMPIGLPRPPPITNPPIYGIGRAPIYSPPPVNPQNQEPEPNPPEQSPIYSPPPERVYTLEPLRTLSIGIPQPTESSSPPQQTVTQESQSSNPLESQSSKSLTTLLGRGLTDIQRTEDVSSPPPTVGIPQPTESSPSPQAGGQTVSQKSQSSNPLGAIGSFFGSIASDVTNTVKDVENAVTSGVTNAAKDVGSAVTGALSTANNAIQNAYGSVYGSQTQQEKQQLQNQLNQVQTQAQQELSQINQQKQQLQTQLQQAQTQAQQELTQINQQKQQLQNQLSQVQQQAQQQLSQINQQKQQVQTQLSQAQEQAQQELTQINQQKQQLQTQLQQAQTQAQQDLSQLNQAQQQIQAQLSQAQEQAQQELTQINQQKQQLQNELQQAQQYQAQAEQLLQQDPGNQQLQSYLQQLQQQQQQIQQGLAQLNQAQQQVQAQLKQAQQQAQQDLSQISQDQQQVQTQLQQAQSQAQQGLAQLNQAQQQVQAQLGQAQQEAQQELTQLNQAQQQVQTQLQQAQSQAQQGLTQLNQAQQQVQAQLQQVQSQAQQELTQLNQAQQQVQTQEQQAQQQVQQQLAQLNKQGGGNPFQQFFNDVADASALVGYYATEGLGGVGEELNHLVTGKGLENFGQAVSQFNKAGGQNVAKTVGDITEVALPAIATAIVAPELLPAVLIGEAASVGIGEGVSKLTTGKWQSLPQVLQEANEGGVLGAIGGAAGSAAEGALAKLGTAIGGKVGDIIAGAGGKALAGAAVNEALTVPFTRNPEQLLLAGVLGAAGGASGELVSKVPFLEQSEAVRNAIDTSEAGAKLGDNLVNEGITKGVLSPDEISGKTTTQIGDLLRQKYNTVSNDIISSLDKDTVQSLKEEGIITDNQVLNPGKFIKSVKDKVPEDQLQLLKDTANLVEKYNEGIEKLAGGYKLRLGNRTLLYKLKLGDESDIGIGSAGKSKIFNDIRTVNDIDKNVAGIYNNPSDVRDTAIGLKTTPKEADFVQNLYDAAKAAKSPLSGLKPNDNIELSFKDLEKDLGPTQTKTLAQTVKDYLENEVGDKNVIIYGSNSVKQYLEDIASRLGGTLDKDSDPNAYLIKRGDEVLWKWRKPGDVDAFIKTDNPNDLQRIAQDLTNRMNEVLGTNRFEAEGNLVIDKITGEHVVDLHMENEASDNFNLYARGSTGADLGIGRPTPNYSDLGVAKVSQIALDKANAVAGLRDISLNDLLKQINEGTRLNNPDYVVYIAKQILKDEDPETIQGALSHFLGEIKDDNLRDYLTQKFSQEFNISESDLLTRTPKGDIENVLNEKYRYLSPASYRFKDAQDFLTLLKLAADLKDDDDLRALYEQLRDEFEERGIIPKDWESKEIDLNSIQNAQKLIDSLSSAGDLRSMFFTSPVISPGAGSSAISSISSPPSPIVSPPSPIVSPPPSPIISSPPSPIVSPEPSPIISPPSPVISPPSITSGSLGSIGESGSLGSIGSPTVSPPSPIISPPSPVISPPSITSPSLSLSPLPSYYMQSSPPPVFSSSSVTQSESGAPLPMGPPPMLPAIMPGGFGGGGNNVQEISGAAGEVIYL